MDHHVCPSCVCTVPLLIHVVDGDSANICKVGLAMNCFIVHLLKNQLQQHRLPPDHSHTWQTDGFFATVEGWLTSEGFRGCRTISELVTFLKMRFASSKAYRDQKMEINVLIANFAFTKWISDCIESKELEQIKVPLVIPFTSLYHPSSPSILQASVYLPFSHHPLTSHFLHRFGGIGGAIQGRR